MDSTTKNLLFLLAAAPMGVGGCNGAPEDGDSFSTFNNTGNTSGPDDETGESDGDGDPGDGDGDGDPGDGDGDGDPGDGDGDPGDGDGEPGDGDGEPGDGDGEPGDGDGDPGDGDGDGDGDPVDACTAYGELWGECYGPEYAMYGYLYCQYFFGYAQYYGPACVGAAEAYFICLSQLPCEQFQVEGNCQTAYAAVADACGG